MKTKLLIVDDEQNIRESLSSHFRFMGYEVRTAGHGKEALEMLEEERVDIVISDIVMPVMNGVDLVKSIRATHPMIRIIMMTGYVTQENALACMRYQVDTLVFKPFEDIAELEQAVERSIEILDGWKKALKQLNDMKRPGGSR